MHENEEGEPGECSLLITSNPIEKPKKNIIEHISVGGHDDDTERYEMYWGVEKISPFMFKKKMR